MKKVIRRILFLFFVFVIAAAAALFFFMRQKKPEATYGAMENATLPTVIMDFEGSEINTLHGYTRAMDISLMRENITPVPADRKLSFTVDPYGAKLKEIAYEVRRIDDGNLIENGTAQTEVSGSKTQASIRLQDILDRTEEYMLILKLSAGDREGIYYYTRIRYYEDTHLAEQLAFVKHFSDLTFAGEATEELTVQLESNNEADNTSFGYTDIHCSYRHVTWSNLNPERLSQASVIIRELDTMVASIELDYQIGSTQKDVTHIYNVREFMSVRYVDDKIWLIAYERTLDQIFEANEYSIVDGQINLGIITPEKLPVEHVDNGNFTAFAIDGELWNYNKATNEAIRLFSFKQSDDDGVRTRLDKHRFRIIHVSEEGDVAFTVYGYMNRGPHEGECGLVFYRYDHAENSLREEIFIPSDKPYEILKDEVGTLSYVGEDQLFYLMFDGSIYAIDYLGGEYIEIMSGLEKDTFVVSEDSSAFAWQEESDIYAGKTVHVRYLDDGTTFTLRAAEGEDLRVLGFMDGDFIYGVAKEADVERDTLTTTFPMYKLLIIDREQKEQAVYERSGIFIRDVEIGEGKIDLERVTRDASGALVAAPQDSLIQNVVGMAETSAIEEVWSDITKTSYILKLGMTGNTKHLLSIATPKVMDSGESRSLNLMSAANEKGRDGRYYAYACGRLADVCYSAGEAIREIYDNMGVVTDGKGRVVWSRANRKNDAEIEPEVLLRAATQEGSLAACLNMVLRQAGISADTQEALAGGSSAYEVLEEYLPGEVLDLQGCVLNQVLYYVDKGYPVLAFTEGDKAELILGYDVFKNLRIYSPVTGEYYKISQEQADSYYATYGGPFISILR